MFDLIPTEILAAAFMTGILVKLVDDIEDKKLKIKNVSVFLGMFYGFLTGYVIIKSPIAANLWMAAVLANIAAGKIDATGHRFGIFAMLSTLVLIGFPQFNFYFILLFLIAAYFDEHLKNMSDSRKIRNKKLSKLASYRLLLEMSAFAVSVYTGQWILFASILFFDLGYALIGKLNDKKY